MSQRISLAAILLALLLYVQPVVAQQAVPGKIIPDLSSQRSDDSANDADDQSADQESEDAADQESEDADQNRETIQSDTDSDSDEVSGESSTDLVADQEDESIPVATSVNMDFLDSGSVPKSISEMIEMQNLVAELAEKCKPATVNIMCNGAQGSGVVVSRDGYILTAAHVISRPRQSATVTFPDGTRVQARTLGVHHSGIDSGMLKISDEGRWPYLDMGESETLNEGQWVFAIGHPGGMDEDRGLVVRVGRLISHDDTVLRTDCTLVGGDSGGPLFDMHGDVIGIHSRIGGSLADNFHVPIDVFSDEWDDLAAGKRIGVRPSPRLGLGLVGDTNEIENIDEDGPAKEAGLEVGDIIIKAGDKDIEDSSDLRSAMRRVSPDDSLTLTVKRGDEELEFELIVGEK